jgi:hypothetical protein
MPALPPQRASVALAALALTIATSGCDVVSRVQDAAGNVQTLSEMADQLKDSSELTYTAEYKNSAGQAPVRLVQDPPRSAYVGPTGSYIAADDATLLCQRAGQVTTCQKAPPQGAAAIADAATLSAVTGQGFVPPSLAIGLLAAASLYPDAKVTESTKTIAGQESACVSATGFSGLAGETAPPVQDFTLCITKDGVLGSFEGLLQNGERGGITLSSYTPSADPAAFQPPKGARIVDVAQLSPR